MDTNILKEAQKEVQEELASLAGEIKRGSAGIKTKRERAIKRMEKKIQKSWWETE